MVLRGRRVPSIPKVLRLGLRAQPHPHLSVGGCPRINASVHAHAGRFLVVVVVVGGDLRLRSCSCLCAGAVCLCAYHFRLGAGGGSRGCSAAAACVTCVEACGGVRAGDQPENLISFGWLARTEGFRARADARQRQWKRAPEPESF